MIINFNGEEYYFEGYDKDWDISDLDEFTIDFWVKGE